MEKKSDVVDTWFKDTERFIQHDDGCLETRIEHMDGFITPNELFFVRNNSKSVALDAATYRLRVEGDAISTPLELSYEELLNMPSRTLFSYLECGGNHRSFFDRVMGRPIDDDTPWQTGGIGMAEWTGVSLAAVLERAGVKDNARDVQLIGLDKESPEGGFRRPMPIEKALDPDTLLAYRMNGAVLPRDHGYPLRAIVPGWVGSSSIKWLGTIAVSSERIFSRNNTTSYVMIGDDYEPEDDEALGPMATVQSIKSTLALPWPAHLKAGGQILRGYAHSPHEAIARVEYSLDGGQSWQDARLLEPLMKYAWARFEIDFDATPGEHIITTRATDRAGNTQPDELPFNKKGYFFNLPLPHPVNVKG